MGLRSYLLRRIVFAIPMFFILITAVFFAMHVIPGDPVRAMLGGTQASEEVIEKTRHDWGLDKPIHIQYFDYISRLFHGDLGVSIWSRTPVIYEIRWSLPVTLELTVATMLISILLSIPIGIYSALKRNTIPDFIIRALSLFGLSIPVFWVGLMCQLSLGVWMGVLPISGRLSALNFLKPITGFVTLDSLLTGNLKCFLDGILHLIAPSLVLATFFVPLISRVCRSSIIEEMGEDYVVAARSKGLTEFEVIYKHVLRNAILPVVTVIGLYFAMAMGGAVITETIFGFPGMGRLLVESIFRRDYYAVQGCVTVYVIIVIIITTAVDMLYAFLDPRVSY